MERFELFPMDAPFADGLVTGHKYGYCFFDGEHRRPGLAGTPRVPHYSFWDCGMPDSQSTRVGLSVGWGDIYLLETKDSNNQAWARVSIGGGTVHVGAHVRSACSGQLPY